MALYVKFHEEAELHPELNDEARVEFTKLEHHDEENIKLWRWFIDISLREYKKTYDQLGITFDSYKGESFYYDKVPAVVEELREKGLLKHDDGAEIVDLEKYGMPPCLILKKDGSSIYPSRDIAAAIYRKKTYDFDKCIYVTSAGQSLHFAQWFKVVELMGYDWYRGLVHVPYGTVSINGTKLATRTGNVILLRDLFAESAEKVREITRTKNPDMPEAELDDIAEKVGVGAIVFYYLSNNRIKDINFMLEDALSYDGNTGPYVQYTYARICSLLSRAGGEVGMPEGGYALGVPRPCARGAARLRAVRHHTLYNRPDGLLQPLLSQLPDTERRGCARACVKTRALSRRKDGHRYGSRPYLHEKDRKDLISKTIYNKSK